MSFVVTGITQVLLMMLLMSLNASFRSLVAGVHMTSEGLWHLSGIPWLKLKARTEKQTRGDCPK